MLRDRFDVFFREWFCCLPRFCRQNDRYIGSNGKAKLEALRKGKFTVKQKDRSPAFLLFRRTSKRTPQKESQGQKCRKCLWIDEFRLSECVLEGYIWPKPKRSSISGLSLPVKCCLKFLVCFCAFTFPYNLDFCICCCCQGTSASWGYKCAEGPHATNLAAFSSKVASQWVWL